ncbi:MAG TPA: energy transducer TonB [Usitatibacter sp.]|nr:energy transducer TonB [Usitatibacter sp.]
MVAPAVQVGQPNSTDALVSFSDFLLERFGLVATMQVALIASIALHAFAIVGVGFRMIKGGWDEPHNVMDVVLVNSRSASRPDKADTLAQANLDGGGNTDQKMRAKSPFPAVDPRDPSPELRAAQSRMKQLEVEAKELMTTIKSTAVVAQGDVAASQPNARSDAQARDLIDKSLEISRLEAQIAREHLAYQQRPKRKFIGARTHEYRFAKYVDDYRARVERVGTLNYPQEAKARKIYASLQLTVAIKSDGEVESVEINRSSGYKFLDQAARRIVQLSAPFEPFPADIRKDTDILHITRTWTFTRADQVVAE